MVQQYQSPIKVYRKPFELVMAAYERRFPTSPLIPVFLGSEVMSEYKSEDGAIHMIERRCKLDIEAPALLKKVIGVDYAYFIQKNTLNRRDRTLVIEARNETFANKVTILETCRYRVHPDNAEWTAFDQEASLKIKSFLGMENAIEKLAMKNYLKNVDKGMEIIQHYLAELERDGITSIAPWKGPEPSTTEAASAADVVATQPKLEAEFIKRYLGDLTSKEESDLLMLRQQMAETCGKRGQRLPTESVLLRFLRAREFSVEKAHEMLTRSLYWRQAVGADHILEMYKQPDVLRDYLPCGWHHFDKDGRPVFVFRVGQLDVKGVMKSVSEEDLIKQLIFINETGMKLASEATERTGRPIHDFTCIVDFEGLGLKHLWRPGVSIIQKIIQQDTANYPETMARLVVIRAPTLFPVAWSIVRNVFDERTRNKIVILGDNFLEQLADILPSESIPEFLGGSCPTSFAAGGPVPEALYEGGAASADNDNESIISADHTAMYQEMAIGRGSTFRLPIQVKDADTVITWDFFVHSGADVGFGVFFTKDSIDTEAHADKLEELEKSVKYKGSVQGTMVCQRAGQYVLRWDNTYSWVTPKTLSYHVDVISSEIYRRSLSSLLSVSTSTSAETVTSTSAVH
ncbi:SEC14-like protein [Capsaspora owczarzaki ATCC 30864]|nr:SEC14-like protein [Capsaspora owczarzaki ATCC 30864]|eukprot:XP_004342753.1 SEC14-like protein [Capsaspora owczarzaki ATCC 30864]